MQIKPKGKQADIMSLACEGANVVVGPAGSGKSVCARLRATYLGEVLEENVLILSYNNVLTQYLKDMGGSTDKHIYTSTYHSFITTEMRKYHVLGDGDIIGKDYIKSKLIEEAMKISKYTSNINAKSKSFVIDEISWMQKTGNVEWSTYQNVERKGRGQGLRKADRKLIFDVFEEYKRLRAYKGYKYDWDDLAIYANELFNQNKGQRTYKHIIIDEGQDFSPMMLRSLATYIGEEGSILFLGDSGQQIYGSRFSWKQLGLKINKVHKLDENYRNSYEIAQLCDIMRTEMNLEEEDVIKINNKLEYHQKPKMIQYQTVNKQQVGVIQYAREYARMGSVAILCRTKAQRDDYYKKVQENGINTVLLERNINIFSGNIVFIGTLHSAKGLEFDTVIIPDCTDEELLANIEQLQEENKEEEIQKRIKLLYVGMSRARKHLLFTYIGQITSLLPKSSELYLKESGF